MNGALTYNEKKVRTGEATILLASRFGADIGELSFAEKLRRFSLVNQRCTRVKNNTVHLVLSFPREDQLTPAAMQAITMDYMQRIGFGNQPYIVYLHGDTNNPHLHIVTTPIQRNGRTIDCHNIVQRLCQPAREIIEKQYNLIAAKGRRQSVTLPFKSDSLPNTIREVVSTYRFTDMEQLNTVLRMHGYAASLGAPGSRQQLNGGIQYCRIDANGNKTGVAVNASAIYTNPGLKYLQRQFAKNAARTNAKVYYQQLQTAWLHASKKYPLLTMAAFLQKKSISIHPQKDLTGKTTQLILVDNNKRQVYTYQVADLSNNTIPSRGHLHASTDETPADYSAIREMTIHLLQQLSYTPTTSPELSPEFLRKKKKRRPHL